MYVIYATIDSLSTDMHKQLPTHDRRQCWNLGHFFDDLIRKINYLDMTQIFNRSRVLKKTWHLVSERTLHLVNVLNHCWCETSLISKLFWSMWHPEILFWKVCVWVQFCILPRMKKSMALYVICIKKASACGLQVGHIQIALWVSGQSRSTGVNHF